LNQTGQLEAARQTFVLQLETAEKVKDPSQTMLAHENLGLVLSDMQHYAEALLQFQEQQRIAESTSNKLSGGYAIMNQGNMLWQLGRYEDGADQFGWALNIANSEASRNQDLLAWLNLFTAQMALSRNDLNEAVERSKRAQSLGSNLKPVFVRATFVLGLAESLSGRYQSGRKLCDKAVELARAMRDPRPLPEALLALSEAALKSGDLPTAASSAAEAAQRFQQANQHESEWRALAIQARATTDRATGEATVRQMNSALEVLRRDLGNESFEFYLRRPDVRSLSNAKAGY
jgi:tetratricopeptide (TPR) repeat protein